MSLDIWVFVRVMVYLEEQDRKSPLFRAWADIWSEIDAQLGRLAAQDFDAYSEMMMDTQVALDLPARHRAAFATTLSNLIAQLHDKYAAAQDPDFKKDLKFEIEELRGLLQP